MNELRCWSSATSTGKRRFHVPVFVRWRDQDAYGHVNNATVFTLLEEARIQAFWRPASGDEPHPLATGSAHGSRTHTLVAGHTIEYKSPIEYSELPIEVVLWISHLGSASAEISYEVWDNEQRSDRECRVIARTTIVFIDPQTLRPRRLTDEESEAWNAYLDDPVILRSDRKTAERFAHVDRPEPITSALNLDDVQAQQQQQGN